MWKNLDLSRYPIVFCNYDWTKPYTGADKDASMGAACSGASLMENSARMCRAITDRYELGALYQECSNFSSEFGHSEDEEMAAFNTAMANAEEILANPSGYTTAQFKKAKENLEAAYQTAQDYATGVEEIHNSEFAIQNEIYDLGGRKWSMINGQWSTLPKGIYIMNGRKIYIR